MASQTLTQVATGVGTNDDGSFNCAGMIIGGVTNGITMGYFTGASATAASAGSVNKVAKNLFDKWTLGIKDGILSKIGSNFSGGLAASGMVATTNAGARTLSSYEKMAYSKGTDTISSGFKVHAENIKGGMPPLIIGRP